MADLKGKIILINKKAKYLFNLSDADEQGQGRDTVSLPLCGCRYCCSAVSVRIVPGSHEADGSCIVFDLGMRL